MSQGKPAQLARGTTRINFGSTDFTRAIPRLFSEREREAFANYIRYISTGDVIFLPSFYIGEGIIEIPTLAYKSGNNLIIYDFRDINNQKYYNSVNNVFHSNIEYVHVSDGFPEIEDLQHPTSSKIGGLYFGDGDYAAVIHAILTFRIRSYLMSYSRCLFTANLYDDGYRITIKGDGDNTAVIVVTLENETIGNVTHERGRVCAVIDDEYHFIGTISPHITESTSPRTK